MEELLRVLGDWLSFFFAGNRYRLVDSKVGATYGDAFIELASASLKWRLTRDRSQILLDCQPVGGAKRPEWYSADLLIRLITGRRVESGVLTEEMARWFDKNLSQIEIRFSEDQLGETVSELRRLKRVRAKELFG